MKKRYLIFFLVFLTWFVPFVKYEYLTYKYAFEFEDGYRATNLLSSNKYLKILKYDEKYAEIYYVSDGGGNVLRFKKENGEWEFDSWKTVWSKSGSADDFIWPYFYDSW